MSSNVTMSSAVTMSSLDEDLLFRVLGYVTFTERERYSNLSTPFKHAAKMWYSVETSFPNRFCPFEEEFDRKYNIKKVLLKYSNIKRADTTKLRNNSMGETSDLITFWSRNKKLVHLKPCNNYGWIRVLREPLVVLFHSCPVTSIDLRSNPATCFNETFIRDMIPADKIVRIKTNFLEGFRLKTFTSLKSLELDIITDGQLKQLIPLGLNELRVTSERFTLNKKMCEILLAFEHLTKLYVNAADLMSFRLFLEVRGQTLKELTLNHEPRPTNWIILNYCPNLAEYKVADVQLISRGRRVII